MFFFNARIPSQCVCAPFCKYANDFLEAGGVCKSIMASKGAMHMAYGNPAEEKERKQEIVVSFKIIII